VIVYHPKYLEHIQDQFHPESPQRLVAVMQKLEDSGLMDGYLVPEEATKDEILLVHTPEYVDMVENYGEGRIDYDTSLHVETYEIALLSAGGGLTAARRSFDEKKPHFVLNRPPGHHAGPGMGGGFCYFNNIAIAAKVLLNEIDRVAILDYDGHHGNGTSDVFQNSKDVVYMSTHQRGIFPGTGAAEFVGEADGEGHIINVPFPGGSGDMSYHKAFDELFHPILDQFKPEIMLLSFGGDSHYRDPLTGLALSSFGYVDLIGKTLEAAKKLCGGRFAIFLEGGYDLEALAEVVAGTIALFKGSELPMSFNDVTDTTGVGEDAVEAAKKSHSSYWNL
jgi:acetoin utilization deacetylase AcuC-like enzyme